MVNRFGTDLTPDHSLQAILHNAMGAWGYNQHDVENQIRAQSLRLRNLMDESLGSYLSQLRQTLSQLRHALPEPTRENPFPTRADLAPIEDLEQFIRTIEALRVSIQGAPMPTQDIVWRKKSEHLAFLDRLRSVDLQLLTVLMDANEQLPTHLREGLKERERILQEYIMWGN